MPKFIAVIEGCAEVIEAEDMKEAEETAYNLWLSQSDPDYYVEEATKENLATWNLEETSDED